MDIDDYVFTAPVALAHEQVEDHSDAYDFSCESSYPIYDMVLEA